MICSKKKKKKHKFEPCSCIKTSVCPQNLSKTVRLSKMSKLLIFCLSSFYMMSCNLWKAYD